MLMEYPLYDNLRKRYGIPISNSTYNLHQILLSTDTKVVKGLAAFCYNSFNKRSEYMKTLNV